MGVAISDWRLAQAVSRSGQMGVVSGTGLSRLLANRLMDGDLAGHVRRALGHFPAAQAIQSFLSRYYIAGGKAPDAPYKSSPVYTIRPSRFLDQLTAAANFVEVFLAKEDHQGLVGINLLEKVAMPNLASLYGAMLAGVDFVVMGAGIPTQIAGILDRLSNHLPATYRLDVQGAGPGSDHRIGFDAESIFPGISGLMGQLKRPRFLPIISSVALAQSLIKRSEGKIDGFVVEGPKAGGHNAPPRGGTKLNERGEPIYGEKDAVDLGKLRQLGLPFWLAGGFGQPGQLRTALEAGAAGIQVGTAFAMCDESGMDAGLKRALLREVLEKEVRVFTSPVASPTGFPFKITEMEGTLSRKDVYLARERRCDSGFLRSLYTKADGTLGYRCPAEPVDDYVRKGGQAGDAVGRICLCNGLAATAGVRLRRKNGYVEPPIITSGDDLVAVGQFIRPGATGYSARDVVNCLLDPFPKTADVAGSTIETGQRQ